MRPASSQASAVAIALTLTFTPGTVVKLTTPLLHLSLSAIPTVRMLEQANCDLKNTDVQLGDALDSGIVVVAFTDLLLLKKRNIRCFAMLITQIPR